MKTISDLDTVKLQAAIDFVNDEENRVAGHGTKLSLAIRHYLGMHQTGELLDKNHFASAAMAHGTAIRRDYKEDTAIRHGITAYLISRSQYSKEMAR